MMDYKETTETIARKEWRRAENVVISNPFQGMPTITFNEENMICLGDSAYLPGPGVTDPKVQADFSDSTKEFPLLHPVTGEVIGTAKYQDIYVMVYSLYMALAAERDVKMIADAQPVEEPIEESAP